MRFIKRLPLDRRDPMSKRFAVEADGHIVTRSTSAFELPTGTTEQRPTNPIDGDLRFNTSGGGGTLEAYFSGTWQTIVGQTIITQQEFDNGDYADTIFGPLAYDVDPTKPQNVFVYVENVWQIPGTNYNLVRSSPTSLLKVSTATFIDATVGETTLFLDSIGDFNPGQSITGTNINSVITQVSATDLTVTFTPGITGPISSGTVVTTTFSTGTFIRFSDHSIPVPNKPVYAFLGFDRSVPPV
jgi:hypothetical protein